MSDKFAADKVFLPYQQALLNSTTLYPVTVVEKSRRTGFSWAIAAIAVMTAAPAENPQNVYYMGYDYEMAREFIQYVGDWAKKIGETVNSAEEFIFKDPDNPDKDIKAFRVTFANGKEVVALPSVARALRGKQGLVIIDEASFHDDLKEVMKAAFALLIWGGKVVIISTHNGEDNPFNELIKDIRSDKKPYNLLRCSFEDALEQGLYKRICQQQKEEWSQEKQDAWQQSIYAFYGDSAAEELDCIPANGSGNYLTRLIIEQCMHSNIPVLTYGVKNEFAALDVGLREAEVSDWIEENLKPLLDKLDKERVSGLGYDFARSSDLSVCWVMQENQDLSLKTCFALELRNMPHEQQKQIAFYILDHLPNFKHAAFDARGNGSYLAEVVWQRYGDSYVSQVMPTVEWYRQNMPRAKAYLEDKTVTIPKTADVFTDFKQVKVVKGVAQVPDARTKDEKGNKRHGDSFIAYVLGIFAMRRENIAYSGYIPLSSLNDGEDDEDDLGFNVKGCL